MTLLTEVIVPLCDVPFLYRGADHPRKSSDLSSEKGTTGVGNPDPELGANKICGQGGESEGGSMSRRGCYRDMRLKEEGDGSSSNGPDASRRGLG